MSQPSWTLLDEARWLGILPRRRRIQECSTRIDPLDRALWPRYADALRRRVLGFDGAIPFPPEDRAALLRALETGDLSPLRARIDRFVTNPRTRY